jgi:hypothetical protein
VKHFREVDGDVHCEGCAGADFTLCGLAPEGENSDTPMVETSVSITCNRCIGLIHFCKRIRASEIALPFERRKVR